MWTKIFYQKGFQTYKNENFGFHCSFESVIIIMFLFIVDKKRFT